MAEKLISVVVPVFNAEKYVNRCIDSILNQTYENLEVILVNDGSVDGSVKICEKWQKLDNRVKLITQENAGVSAARNTGIENATGDYIAFVDNDDWLRPEMFKNLVKQAQKDNADLTFCKFIKNKQNTCFEKKYVNFKISKQFMWIKWITPLITRFFPYFSHFSMWITFFLIF